jgi:hypothetical protein
MPAVELKSLSVAKRKGKLLTPANRTTTKSASKAALPSAMAHRGAGSGGNTERHPQPHSDNRINVSDTLFCTSPAKPACINLRVKMESARQVKSIHKQIRLMVDMLI